ncbi:MAG: glyoxylate/hydroxypyruvate reductase A [Pseudomonadota bacterium]
MIQLLFGDRKAWPDYEAPLTRALSASGLGVAVGTEAAPETVDYIVTSPDGWITDFAPYCRAKAVFNLWAGVEEITGNSTLTQPLVRMVEPGLREGMVEWVTGHVLRHHLGLDRYIKRTVPHWDYAAPPLARNRTVGILGLGELGAASAQALAGLGFHVIGWSRTKKDISGVETHGGPTGLDAVLGASDIVVLLLPATPSTENTLDAPAFSRMRKGVVVLNPGRGTLIDDDALLGALETGQVAHATLDVFREEPLPPAHPFWAHPHVTITPHVASATRPGTASEAIAENIRRGESGQAFLGLVDRGAGY